MTSEGYSAIRAARVGVRPATQEPPEELSGYLPSRLKVRHVAAALNIPPRRARHYFDAGYLHTFQAGRNAQRETTPEALILFALDMGFQVDWEAVAEIDL